MKKHILNFLKRGCIACWGGSVIVAIIYGILGASGMMDTLTPIEVTKAILSSTLMAFIAAGITVIYENERLSPLAAALIHGVALYLDYLLIYLVNGWLADGLTPILIFTAIFIAGYALIWLIIYLITKSTTRRLNEKINQQ